MNKVQDVDKRAEQTRFLLSHSLTLMINVLARNSFSSWAESVGSRVVEWKRRVNAGLRGMTQVINNENCGDKRTGKLILWLCSQRLNLEDQEKMIKISRNQSAVPNHFKNCAVALTKGYWMKDRKVSRKEEDRVAKKKATL